jgi:HAD superfamily hydrolase (TIGR01484 family)
MIKLLSTDFDGTLVNHFEAPAVVPELFEMLVHLQRLGVRWAVNTGRTLDHILEGLDEFNFPTEPDYVLTSERDIFHREPGGQWVDYGDWNRRCARAHDELFAQARPILDEIVAFVQTQTQAKLIDDAMGMGLIASDEPEMDRVVKFLDGMRERLPAFSYQRNTVYLRFCHADYSKGAALGELARLLELSRDEICAAGDHHNDIAMLDGTVARWVACPSNSADEVKATVRNAGGYVARGACGAGVVEALIYFGDGCQLIPLKQRFRAFAG